MWKIFFNLCVKKIDLIKAGGQLSSPLMNLIKEWMISTSYICISCCGFVVLVTLEWARDRDKCYEMIWFHLTLFKLYLFILITDIFLLFWCLYSTFRWPDLSVQVLRYMFLEMVNHTIPVTSYSCAFLLCIQYISETRRCHALIFMYFYFSNRGGSVYSSTELEKPCLLSQMERIWASANRSEIN